MKTVTKILFALTLMVFFANPSSAQKTVPVKESKKAIAAPSATRGKFIDNNKNGICDNFEARSQSGRGANFVDKNGDGICDNRATLSRGQGKGCGKGWGQGNRHRHGNGNCCGR